MTKDFLSETMEVRESVTYFKCWKKITVSSEFFLCMLKLSSRNKGKLSQFQMGEIKRICYKQNYHKIMTKRSFLNRRDWYKKVPWNFRKEEKMMENIKIWVSTIDIPSLEFSKLYLVLLNVWCGSQCIWRKYLRQLHYE